MSTREFSVPPQLSPRALLSTQPRVTPSTALPQTSGTDASSNATLSLSPSPAITTASPSAPHEILQHDEVGDICAAAMDLIAFLDTKTLESLQQQMETRSYDRGQVIGLIGDAIQACHAASVGSAAMFDENGDVLRKSDAEFRAALRSTTHFSLAQLEALVESIDKHGTGLISFSDIMSFLVTAGRKMSPMIRDRDAPPPRTISQLTYDATEIICSTSYFLIESVPERLCFLAATIRWVDIVDEMLHPLPVTKRIAPPRGDPTATIACISFAASLDEVVIGFNNCKIMTFNFVDGTLAREVVVGAVPASFCWVGADASGGRGHLFCGSVDGSLIRVAFLEYSAIRVVDSVRLASSRLSHVIHFPEMHSVVCAGGKGLFVCDDASGSIIRPPFTAPSTVTCAIRHPHSSSLIFATASAPTTLYFFNRRTMRSSRLENPSEIKRSFNGASDSIVLLALDAFSQDQLVSVTASGCISFWDFTKRMAISAVPEEGPEVQLRLPPNARGICTFAASMSHSTVPSKSAIMFGGKNFICSVRRHLQQTLVSTADAAAAASIDSAAPSSNASVPVHLGSMLPNARSKFEIAVASMSLLQKHSAFPNSQQCVINVFPTTIQIVNVLTGALITELSFGSSPLAVNRPGGRNSSAGVARSERGNTRGGGGKQPIRVRSACYGPGLFVLLGTETGNLFTFSLEASTIGDVDLVAANLSSVELSFVFFVPDRHFVGFSDFNGILKTAALAPDCSKLSSIVETNFVHHCDALHYDDGTNLLVVADFEEKFVRVMTIVDTGSRLKPLAKISLYDFEPLMPLPLKVADSGKFRKTSPDPTSIPAAESGKWLSVKVLLAPVNKSRLTKQLFQDENEIAKVFLTSSPQGASDLCHYTSFSLTCDDEEDVEKASDRNPKPTASKPRTYALRPVQSGVINGKVITAMCQSVHSGDSIVVGFSDGSVAHCDLQNSSIVTIPVGHTSASHSSEPIAFLCPIPVLHNIAVSRMGEKTRLLFRLTSHFQKLSASPSVGRGVDADGSPLPESVSSPSRDSVGSPGSTVRKARSAKPERPAPLFPRILRTGSAGNTPASRRATPSPNSILEVLARSSGKRDSSARRKLQFQFSPSTSALPPIERHR